VAAGPALSHEDEITDQRNVVIEFDPRTAMRTTGWGMDNRFSVWDSVDTNVEKASQHEAKQK
jgi:glutamine synthetase